MKSKITYVLIGGEILAPDGDKHYIPPSRLRQLYKLPATLNMIFAKNWQDLTLRGLNLSDSKKFKILTPREDGDYSLEEKTKPIKRRPRTKWWTPARLALYGGEIKKP